MHDKYLGGKTLTPAQEKASIYRINLLEKAEIKWMDDPTEKTENRMILLCNTLFGNKGD